MRIPLLTARIARTVDTVWHLALHTMVNIASEAWHVWWHATTGPATPLLSELGYICRYHLGTALDPRTFFAIDGDDRGRRRGNMDRVERRARRVLAGRRRRLATMLLRTLGGTADEVEAALTRHWQLTARDGRSFDLIPDFLATRLRWREGPTHHQIDIHRWASNISGVWVATPAPVRHYLRRAHQHETRLYRGASRRPRRGVLPLPAPEPA